MRELDPNWSYERHLLDEKRVVDEGQLPSCYSAPGSVDAWRHRRMYEMIVPLLESHPHATWMTLGDGNYASDAHFLRTKGARVLATSLTTASLEIAKQKGYINEYRAENAERLSMEDGAVDFVLCKAAYHHFPRPPVAFYEMVRVARIGVVLIEPQEAGWRVLNQVKEWLKRALRHQVTTLFELSGNYVFRVSAREIVKMMTALNGGGVAVKRFNDLYHPRWSRGRWGGLSSGALLTRLGLAAQDLMCALGLLDYGLATVVVFKTPPSETLRTLMKRRGFRWLPVPVNPYLPPADGPSDANHRTT